MHSKKFKIMNITAEYQQRELLNIVLSTKDEKTISKIPNYAKSLINKDAPCQYSIEEVKEGIKQSIQDVKEGNVVPFEDVAKRFHYYNENCFYQYRTR